MMDKEIATYLRILAESLQNKSAVLDAIMTLNAKQLSMMKVEELDFDSFEASMEEKGDLVEKLNSLDDGFESIYNRIRNEILEHRDSYKDQIGKIQQLIRDITDKNMSIQAQETRLKVFVEQHFEKKNVQLKQKRNRTKAVRNYYDTMHKLNVIDSQFMDRKK